MHQIIWIAYHSSRSSTKSSASTLRSFLSWFLYFDLYCKTVWFKTPNLTSIDLIYVCIFLRASLIFTTGEVSVIVPECSLVLAWNKESFYLDLLQLLADKFIIFVHLLHGSAEIIEVRWQFLEFLRLALVLVSNVTHTWVNHSFGFGDFVQSWGKLIIQFFKNRSSIRETT